MWAVWALLVVQCVGWRENEAGPHEVRSFGWLVHENEMEYQSIINPECSKLMGWEFWNSLKKSKTEVCQGVHRYHNGLSHLLLLENVSLVSSELKNEIWNTPFIESHITVSSLCSEFIFYRHFKPFLNSLKTTTDMGNMCDVWIEEPLLILPWFDSTNWWHFNELALLPLYLYFGIVQVCFVFVFVLFLFLFCFCFCFVFVLFCFVLFCFVLFCFDLI
jgi:hypothetical protein